MFDTTKYLDTIWKVTNSYKELVPDYYTRKQTLANAERYITPELKELEDTILGAEDKLYALEYELYCQVRDSIAKEIVKNPEDGCCRCTD